MKAAVSGFGELWETDDRSRELKDVSNFRICIRCQDVSSIPEFLNLTVDDRRFRIRIVVDSWEDAAPILLGEHLDQHFGLDSSEAQEDFLRTMGFSCIPAADKHSLALPSLGPPRGGLPWEPLAPLEPLQPRVELKDSDFPLLKTLVSSSSLRCLPREEASDASAVEGPSCCRAAFEPSPDSAAYGTLRAHRANLHPASKSRGVKISSLRKVQDRKGKKTKSVRFISDPESVRVPHRAGPTMSALEGLRINGPSDIGNSSPPASSASCRPLSPRRQGRTFFVRLL